MVTLHALPSRPLSVVSLASGSGQASGRDPEYPRAQDLECWQDVTRKEERGLRARKGKAVETSSKEVEAGKGRGGGGRPQRKPVSKEALFRLA